MELNKLECFLASLMSPRRVEPTREEHPVAQRSKGNNLIFKLAKNQQSSLFCHAANKNMTSSLLH